MLAHRTNPQGDLSASKPAATIVVLQQEEMARDALRHWLEEAGFIVRATADGHDAARWLLESDAAVLIVDRIYPGWDGLGTLQAARELRPALRILVTDRHSDLDEYFMPMARSIGADRIVPGRLGRDELLREVRALVG